MGNRKTKPQLSDHILKTVTYNLPWSCYWYLPIWSLATTSSSLYCVHRPQAPDQTIEWKFLGCRGTVFFCVSVLCGTKDVAAAWQILLDEYFHYTFHRHTPKGVWTSSEQCWGRTMFLSPHCSSPALSLLPFPTSSLSSHVSYKTHNPRSIHSHVYDTCADEL